jgi:hypothetical protein
MSLAATFVFLLVSALQMLDQVLDLVKKVSARESARSPSLSFFFPASASMD